MTMKHCRSNSDFNQRSGRDPEFTSATLDRNHKFTASKSSLLNEVDSKERRRRYLATRKLPEIKDEMLEESGWCRVASVSTLASNVTNGSWKFGNESPSVGSKPFASRKDYLEKRRIASDPSYQQHIYECIDLPEETSIVEKRSGHKIASAPKNARRNSEHEIVTAGIINNNNNNNIINSNNNNNKYPLKLVAQTEQERNAMVERWLYRSNSFPESLDTGISSIPMSSWSDYNDYATDVLAKTIHIDDDCDDEIPNHGSRVRVRANVSSISNSHVQTVGILSPNKSHHATRSSSFETNGSGRITPGSPSFASVDQKSYKIQLTPDEPSMMARIITLYRDHHDQFGFVLNCRSCHGKTLECGLISLPYFEAIAVGSAAEQAGIRAGDHLFQVNGEIVAGVSSSQCSNLISNGGSKVNIQILVNDRINETHDVPLPVTGRFRKAPKEANTGNRSRYSRADSNFQSMSSLTKKMSRSASNLLNLQCSEPSLTEFSSLQRPRNEKLGRYKSFDHPGIESRDLAVAKIGIGMRQTSPIEARVGSTARLRKQISTPESSRSTPIRDSSRIQSTIESSRITPTRDSSRIQSAIESSRIPPIHDSSRIQSTIESSRITPIRDSSRIQSTIESSRITPIHDSSRIQSMIETTRIKSTIESPSRIKPIPESSSRFKSTPEISRINSFPESSRISSIPKSVQPTTTKNKRHSHAVVLKLENEETIFGGRSLCGSGFGGSGFFNGNGFSGSGSNGKGFDESGFNGSGLGGSGFEGRGFDGIGQPGSYVEFERIEKDETQSLMRTVKKFDMNPPLDSLVLPPPPQFGCVQIENDTDDVKRTKWNNKCSRTIQSAILDLERGNSFHSPDCNSSLKSRSPDVGRRLTGFDAGRCEESNNLSIDESTELVLPPPPEFSSDAPSRTYSNDNNLKFVFEDKSNVSRCPLDIQSVETDPAGSSKSFLADWSADTVALWLTSLSLGDHAENFLKHSIDGRKLLQLDRNGLIALGVNQVTHRMSIERGIIKLNAIDIS